MKFVFILAATATLTALGCQRSEAPYIGGGDEITQSQRLEKLGRLAFFDESLSQPPGEACATCHDPAAAFTDPRGGPTSKGAAPGNVGTRNTPTAMYAASVPPLAFKDPDDGFAGGLFLDGRVDSLEEQAHKPFLNPIEMGNADAAAVVAKVRAAPYADLFRRTFGATSLDDPDAAFDQLAQALAAFERRPELSPASSKYDAYVAGKTALSAAEARGLALFTDENKGNCAACHPPPAFTDFTYDNLGIPKNPSGPHGDVDHGLMTTLADAKYDGMFRVPTLRNLALTAPYGHNGYFADLRSIVDFYNTRDTRPWPAPEVPDTMNKDELGHLGLSDGEVDDLVAFLYTLTDGWQP